MTSKKNKEHWVQFTNNATKWDSDKVAPEISVSKDGLLVSRTSTKGQNPCALGSHPLNKKIPHFRVEVKKLGTWAGIGIAANNLVLSGSKTLGTQPNIVNSSYFWQSSSVMVRKVQMFGEQSTDVGEIHAGDVIDIVVDFDGQKILYFNNEVLQGWVISTQKSLVEEKIFPAVALSAGSEISLISDSVILNLAQKPICYFWRWDPLRKAAALQLSKDHFSASRKENPKGMNPAVMATDPMTKSRSSFRLQVEKVGKWFGVGLCDDKFTLSESKTLGTQPGSVNAAYFFQNTGINRLQMFGEVSVDNASPINAGDIVDIKIDFDTNRIYFFLNEKFQGYLSPTQTLLQEGKLYPCVDLSVGCVVHLINLEDPELDINTTIHKLTIKEDQEDWIAPEKQFPTQWKWGTIANKKSSFVTVSEDGFLAKREGGGSNPAVMTTQPLTRSSNYFVVKVTQLGNWVGIGVADSSFQLNGSKTLGQQTTGINTSYFFQANVRKLQMFGEKSVPDRSPIKNNDIISVKVDFDTSTIHYFNNDVYQGCIVTTKIPLQEGKIFPCVNLSSATEVTIVNVDHMPLVVAEPPRHAANSFT